MEKLQATWPCIIRLFLGQIQRFENILKDFFEYCNIIQKESYIYITINTETQPTKGRKIMKVTREFKTEKEVIQSRIHDKWSSNYGTLEKDAKEPLNEGHYIECSRKHLIAPWGINFPAVISFDIK